MKIIIELLTTLLILILGYVGACQYLKYGDFKKIDKDCLNPGRNRIIYLCVGALVNIGLVILFNTLYVEISFLEQMKILILTGFIYPMAIIDYRVHKIPNQLLLIAFVIRIIIYVIEFIISKDDAIVTVKSDLAGAVIIGGFFLIILLVFKNSIGMGDIKLFALMGLYQGLLGAFNSVFFSLIVSFFISLALLLSKRKNRKDVIPFGPSIYAGTVVGILLTGL